MTAKIEQMIIGKIPPKVYVNPIIKPKQYSDLYIGKNNAISKIN